MAKIPESDASAARPDAASDDDPLTLPVVEERLRVGTRRVDAGRGVRVSKSVTRRPYQFEQSLLYDELEVRRVPVDEVVALEAAPVARYEGQTLIVPVLEEVLVVEKRVRIREEVRITRRARETVRVESGQLRAEQVDVERFDEAEAPATRRE
jgi:uncharacterized protein (TIGR02271 family)